MRVARKLVEAEVSFAALCVVNRAIAQAAGMPAQTFMQAEFCGKGLAVEHDGEVYSCDRFVYPEYRPRRGLYSSASG